MALPSPRSPRSIGALLIAFVAVFISLSALAFRDKSATFDEPIHLASGYAALKFGDYRYDPTHPPLARMWAAMPLLFMDVAPVNTARISSLSDFEWVNTATDASRQFLFTRNDADRLLQPARVMMAIAGAAIGIGLFFWALEIFGLRVAALLLGAFALVPELLAHSSLVTTDLALTGCVFAAAYSAWRWRRAASWRNVLALSLATGGALVAKYSGVLVVPLVVTAIALVGWRHPARRRECLATLAVVAIVSYVTIWAVFGFRYAPSEAPDWLFHLDQTAIVQGHFGGVVPLLVWIDSHHLLPNAYAQGLVFSQAAVAELPAFLAGQYSPNGFWYYFPFAFAIKTPIALLVLFVAGVAALAWRRRRPAFALFAGAPVAWFLGLAMLSHINIGVRHILPIYPFVLLLAGAGIEVMLESRRTALRVALGVLAAFWVVQVARVYPNWLSFFNPFVGGPRYGARFLADSNIDWGQDLKPLKSWMDENGVTKVNLAYFGSADPAYYGIDYVQLPVSVLDEAKYERPQLPGYVAVSATTRTGVYLPRRWRLFYRALRRQTPVARINNSINVYWLEKWPEIVPLDASGAPNPSDLDGVRNLGDSLRRLQWFNHASRQYALYLKYRPAEMPVRMALVNVLLRASRFEDAEAESRRAIEFAANASSTADQAAARDLLGRALAGLGRLDAAREAFESALALDPSLLPARQALEMIRRSGSGRSEPSPKPAPPPTAPPGPPRRSTLTI
jgi:4-amino-4-deoxy-L-arabinose transferase-like glycosyltransferase